MNSFRVAGFLSLGLLASALVACGSSDVQTGRGNDGSGGTGDGTGGSGIPPIDPPIDIGTGGGTSGPVMRPCTSTAECLANEICAGNTCAPVHGTCSSDSNCGGDTYCCSGTCRNDGAAEGVCIPYGYGTRGTTNDKCRAGVEIGVFSPSVQCDWTGPTADQPFPDSPNVLVTPLVADLPNNSGAAVEIVVISYNGNDGFVNPQRAPGKYGVIRILNGQTCELLETVADADPANQLRASAAPALADLDGDGTVEIVARRNNDGLIAFKWNGSKYERMWVSAGANISGEQTWDGPSLHDLNNDGLPEVLLRGDVYDGRSGNRIPDTNIMTNIPFYGLIPVAGDLDLDGKVELIGMVRGSLTYHVWTGTQWAEKPPARFGIPGSQHAYADFGTPGAAVTDFDPKRLDGKAEIVSVADDGRVTIHTLTGQSVMLVSTGDRGGPPNVGDFDGDGMPEVGIAGKTRYRVFDFDCAAAGAGCEAAYIRWSRPIQDLSSAVTGSSIFDFDADKKAEVVYADECFVRVFEGLTGKVLYSAYRTSPTWYEGPAIADVDRDDSTEIVVNSTNYGVQCGSAGAYVDPLHPGVACDEINGCDAGMSCVGGYCRCNNDRQCGEGLTCTDPLAGTAGSGRVCRATHPNVEPFKPGVRVLRERLDRWVSSRPMWNQHAYSVTNIGGDGKVPKTSEWTQNFTVPTLNNYRAQVQGSTGFGDFPDITGALNADNVCAVSDGQITLTASVCNRGTKAVGAAMPATFYNGEPSTTNILCVSFTAGPVPVGGCMPVSCTFTGTDVTGVVTMVVNDNGGAGQTTVECDPDNNVDSVTIAKCDVVR